jgi:hypothetical protein
VGSGTGSQVGDATARERTGRGWEEWFELLDDAGCRAASHREIADHLTRHHAEIGGWWVQTVTVHYERARGLRAVHETTRGFVAGISRTVDVPVERLFEAFVEPQLRRAWLADDSFEIRRSTPYRSVRANFRGVQASLVAGFDSKGPGKSLVAVSHEKLDSPEAVDESKQFWRARLDALRDFLTG